MTFPRVVKTDLGPEYSMQFTQELSRFGISHEGQIPNTSNQQGSIEQAIKLLRAMLGKIVSLNQYGGRDNWEICLPICLKNINESAAYLCPLSRAALTMGPLHYSNPAMVIDDPFLLQQNSLDYVNLKRIKNLTNKKVSKHIIKYEVGNYVLLAGITKTTQGSKSNVSPRSQDIFKVTAILKDGFGLKLKNLRTNSIQTVTHEKIRLLNLTDLVAQNITESNFFMCYCLN